MTAAFYSKPNFLCSRKRGRDDDEEDQVFGNGLISFQEHRNVGFFQFFLFPISANPQQKQKRAENVPMPLQPRTIPISSPESQLCFNPWASSQPPSAQSGPYGIPQYENPKCDTEIINNHHLDPDFMQLDAATPDNLNHTNSFSHRMPTPIQPSFVNQMHGRKVAVQVAPVRSSMVPRSMEETDWSQTRRLPSPISEGESDYPNSPSMILDAQFAHEHYHRVDMELREQQFHAMRHEHLEQMGGMPIPPQQQLQAESTESEMGVNGMPILPKKGHTRSRHTLNSWTCKPGMKRAFSIGYRADCEKCRLKVPGHFNHIVIS